MVSALSVAERPSASNSELLRDGAVATVALLASVLVVLHGGRFVSRPSTHNLGAATLFLIAASTLPLWWWRREPLGVFVATGVANVALAAFVYPIGLPVGPAVALYLLAIRRNDADVTLARIGAASAALLLAYVATAALRESTIPGFELVHAALLWAVAWFAGERARLRREQIGDLKREAQRERQLAAADERARIARDLHDSAGHAINVIAIRAGAARLRFEQHPESTLVALQAIEDLARRTAGEIDHIVGVLRERQGDGSVEPPCGLASLGGLVAQHAGAGLEIACTTTGTSPPLGRTLDQAAYRILQEALTNASRHGAGTADVALRYRDDALELCVTNPVTTPCSREPNGGHGIIGMRERAALLGGDIHVEHTADRFSVRARLPYQSLQS
jgi:signal transduction histidine kinase